MSTEATTTTGSEPSRSKSPSIRERFDSFVLDWRRSRSKSKIEPHQPRADDDHAGETAHDKTLTSTTEGSTHDVSAGKESHCDANVDALGVVKVDEHLREAGAAPSSSSRAEHESCSPDPVRDCHTTTSGDEETVLSATAAGPSPMSASHPVLPVRQGVECDEKCHRIRHELALWRLAQPSGSPCSLLSIAVASHRSIEARNISEQGLRALETVRWPLLTATADAWIDRRQEWITRFILELEERRRHRREREEASPMTESDAGEANRTMMIVQPHQLFSPSFVPPVDEEEQQRRDGGCEASPCKRVDELLEEAKDTFSTPPPPTSQCLPSSLLQETANQLLMHAAGPRTHLRHRVMDFFESYDPQRLPSDADMERVLSCGIPEPVLFAFLQVRYGLSSPMLFGGGATAHANSFGSAPGGGGGGVHHLKNVTTAVLSAAAAAAAAVLTGDAAQPPAAHTPQPTPAQQLDASINDATVATDASPDFGLHTPYPERRDISVDADPNCWPPAWRDAVLNLVPKTAELSVGGVWNTQSSKPGLANPKTAFSKAVVPRQLFVFHGVWMELVHADMEAHELVFPSAPVPSSSQQQDDDTKKPATMTSSTSTSSTAARTHEVLTNVAGLVAYPWPQSLVLEHHRRRHHTAVSSHRDDDEDKKEETRPRNSQSGEYATKRVHNMVEELDRLCREHHAASAQSLALLSRRRDRSKHLHAVVKTEKGEEHEIISSSWMSEEMGTAMLDGCLSWSRNPHSGTATSSLAPAVGSASGTGGATPSKTASNVTRHDVHVQRSKPPLERHVVGNKDRIISTGAGAGGGGASSRTPLMYFEDHWDADDLDLRDVPSPLDVD